MSTAAKHRPIVYRYYKITKKKLLLHTENWWMHANQPQYLIETKWNSIPFECGTREPYYNTCNRWQRWKKIKMKKIKMKKIWYRIKFMPFIYWFGIYTWASNIAVHIDQRSNYFSSWFFFLRFLSLWLVFFPLCLISLHICDSSLFLCVLFFSVWLFS